MRKEERERKINSWKRKLRKKDKKMTVEIGKWKEQVEGKRKDKTEMKRNVEIKSRT